MTNLLLFSSTVLIWGTTWIAIALQIGPVPVLVSVFYRFALAALVLAAHRDSFMPPASSNLVKRAGLSMMAFNVLGASTLRSGKVSS